MNLVHLTFGPLHRVRAGAAGAPVHSCLFSLLIHLKEADPRPPETMRKAEEGVLITESKLVGKNARFV